MDLSNSLVKLYVVWLLEKNALFIEIKVVEYNNGIPFKWHNSFILHPVSKFQAHKLYLNIFYKHFNISIWYVINSSLAREDFDSIVFSICRN
jgi:hypothetical protein